jgi:hypothetical protein
MTAPAESAIEQEPGPRFTQQEIDEASDMTAEIVALATQLDRALDRLWSHSPAAIKAMLDSRPGLNLDCREFLKAARALAAEIEQKEMAA